MKFTTWQLVAILAIMFAALICVHLFAPTEAATVVSMVTVLFSSLFVQRATPGSDEKK